MGRLARRGDTKAKRIFRGGWRKRQTAISTLTISLIGFLSEKSDKPPARQLMGGRLFFCDKRGKRGGGQSARRHEIKVRRNRKK